MDLLLQGLESEASTSLTLLATWLFIVERQLNFMRVSFAVATVFASRFSHVTLFFSFLATGNFCILAGFVG